MLNGTLPNSVIRINNTSKLVKNSNVGYFSRNLNRPECRKTKDDKYIWYSQTGRELYFNLRDDPHETKNALDENPERVAELRALLINALKNREEQYTDGHTLFVGKTPLTVLQNTEVL